MAAWLDDWYRQVSKRAEFCDQLARIREEAGDHEGAEKARQSAASMRP